MSKVIDIFTRKEVDDLPFSSTTSTPSVKTEAIEYNKRQQECLNYVVNNNKPCNCVYCISKSKIARQLAYNTVQIVKEHNNNSGIQLNIHDMLDIAIKSSMELEQHIAKLLMR